MIGTIDIKVNAAHPNLPLDPFYVFVSAPSSPRVINVPKRIGTWEITKVFVSANFPDNTVKSVEMRNVAGCWVGTLPACDVVGDSANGFQVTADGIDEAGNPVTGYCLGKGDLFVMSRAGNITVNGTTWYFNFKDTIPEHPVKGDAAIFDGTLKWFNGTDWVQFGGNAEILGKLPLRPLPKYLHALSFDDTYPADAEAWYASLSPEAMGGACSTVRRGGFLYRNYDWTFDSAAEFVVRMSAAEGRHASVGVASLGASLTEDEVASGVYTAKYRALPGMTLDGINDAGVVAEINVDGGPKTGWHGTGANALHILAAVRWVLDHGETAAQAAEYIAANVKQPTGDLNFHFMIADGTDTYIVENGESHLIDAADAKVLTNYALYDEAHAGGGKERYTLLAGGAAIEAAHWTNAYAEGNDWDSDFESAAAHASAITQWAEQGETKESHRGKTTAGGSPWWQTVHTSVYDFEAKTLKVAVQESGEYFTFAVDQANVDLSQIETQIAALQSDKRDKTDRSFERTEEYEDWTPSEHIVNGVRYHDIYWSNAWGSYGGWAVKFGDGQETLMGGDVYNIDATELTFLDGTKTYKKRTITDTLALESQLARKVDAIPGKGLSTNDYTDADKAEVAKVKDKADEYSDEWVVDIKNSNYTLVSGPVFIDDPEYGGHYNEWVIELRGSDGIEDMYKPGTKKDKRIDFNSTVIATRKRVLYTGDAPATSDIIDPALAAAVGKIADAKLTRDFVNTMVSTNSAHYLTARAGTAGAYTYPPFASASALRAAVTAHTEQNPQFFYAGEAFTPTKNDWVIVSEDEDHPLGTITPASRYGFVGTFGSGGSFQYQVSYKLPLTTAQIAALDSGATATRLSGLESDGKPSDTFATDLLGKQVAKEAIIYKANTTSTLKDRAFNALSLDGTEYNLSTALAAVTPTVENQPRDLLIVATATAQTTISYTAGTIKGDKPTIDGSGTWLITLTEYASGVWYCHQIKMEDAA